MDKQRMIKLAGLLNESKMNEAPVGKKNQKINQAKEEIIKAKENLPALHRKFIDMMLDNSTKINRELKSLLEGLEWVDSRSQEKYHIKEIVWVSTRPESDVFSKNEELKVTISLRFYNPVSSNQQRGKMSTNVNYSLDQLLELLQNAN